MNSEKILLTGAGGYIGSHAAHVLLENGYEVVGIDNFSTGYKEPLAYLESVFGKEKFRYYDVDLTDKIRVVEVFEKESGISAVMHFAASCSVNESVENPYKYFTNNVLCSLNLLEIMKDRGVKRFVFSSTCALYGSPEYMPVDEKHPTHPESPYGESKLIAEQVIHWYGKLFGISYTILRYFNVCGALESGELGDSKRPSSLLVQNAVRGALGLQPFELTCGKVNTPDGTPIRDYINVVDLAGAHMAALKYLSNGGESDLFNLGTGVGSSVLDIVKAVQKITGVSFDLKQGEARKGESEKIVADTTKVSSKLGWKASRSLEDSVRALETWYKKHPNGWSS